ncbi:hypothetical protein QEA29_004110 [Salmonella enterica]|nr:hypothetical protein [Salmonella enterica]EKT1325844.1 hypothetical protein [Salmonella enterica]EKT1358938.1 hypothetical protein [Salmonella enterica]EKT2635436.1 hypothetical protein [Salmonella enterica]EKT3223962.1 hypothetical protein [Salmonella enterica]
MPRYLVCFVLVFSFSALGMGQVNELCHIGSVKKVEVINLPLYVTTQTTVDEETFKLIYVYKVVINGVGRKYSGEIIDLLKIKYNKQESERGCDIRWNVNVTSKENDECDLFFDGFGMCGKVNGINIVFKENRIIEWAKKESPLFSQDPDDL